MQMADNKPYLELAGKALNGDNLPKGVDFFADETKKKQSDAWLKVAETAMMNVEVASPTPTNKHYEIYYSDKDNNVILSIKTKPEFEIILHNKKITNDKFIELLNSLKLINTTKTLGNTDSNGATKNVKDIVFWGDGDMWKLLSKASSQNEGWMKSSKAMEIDGVGCVVQVTTQNKDNVAEAVVFVPKCTIEETKDNEGKVVSRKLKIVH
jgi:hypothetical protein